MVFNATFNNISVTYIVTVSFIGQGNWSTQRKSLTCCKALTNFISYYSYKYTSHERDSNSQLQHCNLRKLCLGRRGLCSQFILSMQVNFCNFLFLDTLVTCTLNPVLLIVCRCYLFKYIAHF
jgi:hypothetical protein